MLQNGVEICLLYTSTTEIFGQPVFKYTYREAVIEGYLVDHLSLIHIYHGLLRKG